MKELATIQRINDIKVIPDADKIELAFVKGWQVVVAKKDNFKVGDMVIYVEIDSQMPDKPEYEFLRDRKFRVRTIKLRKQLSQGLILPLSYLTLKSEQFCGGMLVIEKEGGNIPVEENLDVTDILGIVKYDPQAQEEKTLNVQTKHQNSVLRFCMGFKPFRTVYFALNKKESGFPSGVNKTDEDNIQNVCNIVMNNFDKSFYITEKLEGQSATFFTTNEKFWGFNRRTFGVCSRNIRLGKPDNSKYWQTAKKYNLEKILKDEPTPVSIQGEQVGEGIQGNIYKIDGVNLYVFNINIGGKRLNYKEMADLCKIWCLPTVPMIFNTFIPSKHIKTNDKQTIVDWFLNYSNGISSLYNTKREGIVCRLWDNPEVSFKVRSPNYLIEHEE